MARFVKGQIPWNKGLVKRSCFILCKVCKKRVVSYLNRPRIYCSKECHDKGMVGNKNATGHIPVNAFPKGHIPWCKRVAGTGKMKAWNKGIEWISFRGENHPRWKGGKRGEDYLARRRFRVTIQKTIFERDNYTCQMCGSKKDLQVDHIQSWAKYIELRFDINNCRTLCSSCHYKITFGRPMPSETKAWGHNLLKGGVDL